MHHDNYYHDPHGPIMEPHLNAMAYGHHYSQDHFNPGWMHSWNHDQPHHWRPELLEERRINIEINDDDEDEDEMDAEHKIAEEDE